MIVGDDPPKSRGRHRTKVEEEMIKRREREFKHKKIWEGADSYYKRWDKVTNKFDQWTSPRYYEDNNKMLMDLKSKRDKEELLQKRRDRLKKLLDEEDNSYKIELMVKKSSNMLQQKSLPPKVSTETLKDINNQMKLKEEQKRKREAELKLYHQWRINNPIVRQYESKYRFKDLKLSWLDQQIEKQMQKEKEEKENLAIIKKYEEKTKRECESELEQKKQIEEAQIKLKEQLDKQVEDLKEKQRISEEIRKIEYETLKHKTELEELMDKFKQEEKKRLAKEIALYNIKHHRMQLKQKTLDVQEALAQDRELVLKLKKLHLEDLLQDEKKKLEVKQCLTDFLSVVREQQDLEKQREEHLNNLFESEARAAYRKQLEIWRKEEVLRQKLLKDVLDTVKQQIEENVKKKQECQRQILKEREEIIANIEKFDSELNELKKKEEECRKQRVQDMDEQIKLKNARKKELEHRKMNEIEQELERVRKEEERLQKEIMEIHNRQGPYRPRVRKLF